MNKIILGPNEIFRACVCLALSDSCKTESKDAQDYEPFVVVLEDAASALPTPNAWQLVLNILHTRRGELASVGKMQQDWVRSELKKEAFRILRSLDQAHLQVGGVDRKILKSATLWDPNDPVERYAGEHMTAYLSRILNEGGYRLRIRAGKVRNGRASASFPVLDVIGAGAEKTNAVSLYLSPVALRVGIGLPNLSGKEFRPMLNHKSDNGCLFDWRDVDERVPRVGEMMVSKGAASDVVAFFAVDYFLDGFLGHWLPMLTYSGAVKGFLDAHLPRSGGLAPLETLSKLQREVAGKLFRACGCRGFMFFDTTARNFEEVLF